MNGTTIVHTLQQDVCYPPATGHGGRSHSNDPVFAACTERSLFSSVETFDAESRAARQDGNKGGRNRSHMPTVESGATSYEDRTRSCHVRSVRLPTTMADVKAGFPKPESENVNSAPTRNSYGGEKERAPYGDGPPLPSLSALPMGYRRAKGANGKAEAHPRKSDNGVPSHKPKKRQNRRKEGIFSSTDRSSIATEPRNIQLPILVR